MDQAFSILDSLFCFFFLTGTHWFWTGTHDFSQVRWVPGWTITSCICNKITDEAKISSIMPSKLPITIIIVMLHPYVDILYHVVQYKILKPAQQRVLGLKGQYLKGKSKAKLKFPAQIREILHGECDKSMHIPWKNTLYTVQTLYRKQCK